jgi:putative Ca2+/H+ antiporter (TMEM165/GDT1 family)
MVMIDWNLLGLSFITVFLAELGDKSQFAAIALSGTAKSAKAVFFGSVAALILASLIGVLIGEGTAQILPTRYTKLLAAIGFAGMAVKLLFFGDAAAATVEDTIPES